jgi:chromosome segregation ATPase
MTDKYIRAINRAIVLLPDEYQDEREAARTALHRLFRKQVKTKRKLARLRALWQASGITVRSMEAELEHLRKQVSPSWFLLGTWQKRAKTAEAELERLRERLGSDERIKAELRLKKAEAELERLRKERDRYRFIAMERTDPVPGLAERDALKAELERLRKENEHEKYHRIEAEKKTSRTLARLHRIEEAVSKALEELKDPAPDLYTWQYVVTVLRAALEGGGPPSFGDVAKRAGFP